MDSGTADRIEDWPGESFAGGYSSLAALADREFSGAIRSGGTWLFVLNGRVVGVSGGTIEDFEGAGGTAFEAPHPGLPLLFAMQERGGETRARYFTDETPLSEVHDTLSSGSFTGYVELAENVHSGDYYVVYYGGRALTVAFVGGTGRLLTDDEAFEQAVDEVGIFEVRDVDLVVQDLPEPDESDASAGGAAAPAGATGATDEDVDERDADGDDGPTASPAETGASVDDAGGSDDGTGSEDDAVPAESDPSTSSAASAESGESGDSSAGDDATPEEATADEEEPTADPRDPTPRSGEDDDRPREPEGADADGDSSGGDATVPSSSGSSRTRSNRGVRTPEGVDPFSEEQAWREARAVPALDPEETERGRGSNRPRSEQTRESAEGTEEATTDVGGEEAETDREDAEDDGVPPEKLQALESEISELRDRLGEVESERDDLEEERDRLERRVEETSDGDGSDERSSGRSMSPGDALDQTDLLVRYGSKSEATLDDAHGDAEVTGRDVDANLRLETHTRFDADDVSVEGQSYDSFVRGTLEYRFAAWVARELLFEIRDTKSVAALGDLYDAIPGIDRVEFGGTVSMRDDEGEEVRQSFDVVFRDQMGQAVAVADLNDDRDPATGDMMADLLEAANVVAEGHNSLAAAFSVTASFFEPAALETANEATSAGLLNRDSRRSFVKTSRKRGYHLCLVEAHGEEFRLAVPDLSE